MRACICVCVCVCVCVEYKYGVFDCQSPSDTLSYAVFSYGDLRTYIRHCCVLICTMDSDVACGGWLYRLLYWRTFRLLAFSNLYCNKSNAVRSVILYIVKQYLMCPYMFRSILSILRRTICTPWKVHKPVRC